MLSATHGLSAVAILRTGSRMAEQSSAQRVVLYAFAWLENGWAVGSPANVTPNGPLRPSAMCAAETARAPVRLPPPARPVTSGCF